MPEGVKHGGRVKGTPNKSTLAIRTAIWAADPIGFMSDVMRGRMPNIGKDGINDGTFTQANQTSRMQAAQFLAKRIAPEAKENLISFDIGKIENSTEALRAIGVATAAVATGKITPSEGKTICDMLMAFTRLYEHHELVMRLEALEAKSGSLTEDDPNSLSEAVYG